MGGLSQRPDLLELIRQRQRSRLPADTIVFGFDGTIQEHSLIPLLALIEMMQHRFHVVIALALVTAGLAHAELNWVKLRSANFELYTSAGERAGRRTIQQFERTRTFFQQAMQVSVSHPKPVRIVLFRSKKEYLPYRPGEVAAAYYLPGRNADLIVLVAGNEPSVAIHEYVHLLVRHSGLELPLWINEGLADLYSSLQNVGGKVVVGHAPPARIATLRREKWVPLEQVLLADHDSQHYTEKERAGKFYAESWALTHMLNLSQEFRSDLGDLLELLTAGTSSVTALETVYGMPIQRLQRELQSYVRQDRLTGLVFDIRLEKSAEGPSAETAAGLEVGLLLADLLAGIEKTEGARAMYEKVSSENPEAPGPYEGLGYLEYRLGDKDKARVHFGRAFDMGSKNPGMLLRYASLQREAGDEQIVMTLLRAVRASPEDIEARLALGSHLMHRDSYAQAAVILEQVRNANPEQASRALRMLAHAHFKLNRRERARQAATQLLELAQTPEETKSAQRLLALLEPDPVDAGEGRTVPRVGSRGEFGEREAGPTRDEARVSPQAPQNPRPREETRVMAGSFVRLGCLGNQARVDLEVDGGIISLLIEDGGRVEIKGSGRGSMDLHCGAQEPRRVVVRFLPSENAELGTLGVVRTIEFTGPAH